MNYQVEIEGRTHVVRVRRADDGLGWILQVDDGPEEHIRGQQVDAAEWLFDFGGRRRSIGCHVQGETAQVQIAGHALRAAVIDPRDVALDRGGAAAAGELRTPMPGVVVRVHAQAGDRVEAGQVLVVVEAMKMENEYKSPIAGIVGAVHVAPGQPVEADAMLVVVEPEGA